jgi:hypothetical protein
MGLPQARGVGCGAQLKMKQCRLATPRGSGHASSGTAQIIRRPAVHQHGVTNAPDTMPAMKPFPMQHRTRGLTRPLATRTAFPSSTVVKSSMTMK